MLTDSPADILRAWLITNALAIEVSTTAPQDWQAYSFAKPDTPDRVVVVYNTAGILDGREQRTGRQVQHHGVQIYIRDRTDRAAWVKGIAIQTALEAVTNEVVTVGSKQYRVNAFTRSSSLHFTGEEEKSKRRQYTINGTLTITEV